jgi:ACS family D-galactonate transporter-like MFS transporter
MASDTASAAMSQPALPVRRVRRTELDRFPGGPRRFACLGIVVLATVVLYYQFYLAGAVAAGTNGHNGILVDYHMSFTYYINVAVVGYLLGAMASFVTGAADRYGRVNIITVGLLIVGLLCLVGVPLAHTKVAFAIVFTLIGVVEGVILVATPALIRDFSPQLGRASAMGFWTLGPVLGSLVVSIQISSTSITTPWHDQYAAAGIVGIVVAALSGMFLRELTPELRDQLMVSARDRALIEARAAGIDVEASLRQPFRQMLKPDIVLSAFAISVFLIIYYIAVGFFPTYFQTVFGFSQSKANSLGNYVWAFDAGTLLLIGFLSDKIRVRKPFMVVGALGAIVMTIIFATRATHPTTSYTSFVVILSLLALFLGVAYAPWMASFTETVEKRNPALVATGLSVWGLVIRLVIAVVVFILPHVVTTVSTLVEKGPVAQSIAAAHPGDIATASKIDPATTAALGANPKDTQAQVKALSEISGVSAADVTTIVTLQTQHPQALLAGQAIDTATGATLLSDPSNPQAIAKAVHEVSTALHVSLLTAEADLVQLSQIPPAQLLVAKSNGVAVQKAAAALTSLATNITPADAAILTDAQKAAADSPKQWRNYFWVAVGGEIVFIPLIFLLTGAWSPARAKREEEEHEAMVERELEALRA